MKRLSLLFLQIIFLFSLNAQVEEFYGVLPKDLDSDTSAGVIFKVDSSGANYEELFRFPKTLGGELSNLTKVSSGSYYGFAGNELIEYNPNSGEVSYLISFERDSMISDGLLQSGPFVLMPNNKLYATTENGGIHQGGVLYSINLDSLIYTKVIEFDYATIGSNPSLSLIRNGNSTLLGTLSGSSTKIMGGIFEFDITNDSLLFIHEIPSTSPVGAIPSGKLINNNTKIYGINNLGAGLSFNTNGVLYEYDYSIDSLRKIFDFKDTLEKPIDLFYGKNNKIYGTSLLLDQNNRATQIGCIFEIDPLNGAFSIKKTLILDSNSTSNRWEPIRHLIQDSIGRIYGVILTTSQQMLYRFDPFQDTIGALSKTLEIDNARLNWEFAQKENLQNDKIAWGGYALASEKPSLEVLDVNSLTTENKALFNHSPLGEDPEVGLLQASNNKLYGVTTKGGKFSNGVFFEFEPGSRTLKVIHHNDSSVFPGAEEVTLEHNQKVYFRFNSVSFSYDLVSKQVQPFFPKHSSSDSLFIATAPSVAYSNTKLYGSAVFVTPSGEFKGYMYEYNPLTDSIQKLITFNSLRDGTGSDRLVLAEDGQLYGSSFTGGLNNKGTIFSFDPLSGLILKRIDIDAISNSIDIDYFPSPFLIADSVIQGLFFDNRSTFNRSGGFFQMNIYNNNFDTIKTYNNTIGVLQDARPVGQFSTHNNKDYFSISATALNGQLSGIIKYNSDSNKFSSVTLINFRSFLNSFPVGNRLLATNICYPTRDSASLSVCDTYTSPSGKTSINTAGNYLLYDTIANNCGGDSLLVIRLTLRESSRFTNQINACESYTWIDGITYTASNDSATWVISGGASNGCDSVVALNLTITNIDTNLSITDSSLVANDSLSSYRWLDCKRSYSEIVGETSREFIPQDTGFFAVEYSKNGCLDTSACVLFQPTSLIENNYFSQVRLFPNPTDNELFLDLGDLKNVSVNILSLEGKLLYSNNQLNNGISKIELNFPKGIYLVQLNHNGVRKQFKIEKL